MKPTVKILLVIVCVSGLLFSAAAQSNRTNGANSNYFKMNFVNAPLEDVLDYLSDTAGFIVVQAARVSGSVTVVGNRLTKDQVVSLVNTELNKHGYTAIRNDRMLTIVDKNDAKTRNIPVKLGNDPNSIPKTDEVATWIIPIQFVEARQLVTDLFQFVSPQATIVANEAGNTIVVTDTQARLRHLVQIIQAVDTSAKAGTEIRVFPLRHASPVDVADELSSVFPNSNSSDDQAPVQFGGAAGTDTSSQQRLQKAVQVTAVADSRIQAVIVTAPKDLMKQIASMISALDVTSKRDQKIYVFHMNNGDPQEIAQELQNIFSNGNTTGTSTSSSQTSALMQRAQQTATAVSTTSTTSSGSGSAGTGGGGGSGKTL
jgi:type II secretory pathway component GspD/PulD (secretin)